MLTATILNWDGVSLGRVYAGWLGGGGCFMVGHCLLLDTNCIHPGEFPIGSYLKVKGCICQREFSFISSESLFI